MAVLALWIGSYIESNERCADGQDDGCAGSMVDGIFWVDVADDANDMLADGTNGSEEACGDGRRNVNLMKESSLMAPPPR
eukprot:1757057-Ditylum_brightwellii.AAC.1